jgi:mono/diheme cytochrome c family protein
MWWPVIVVLAGAALSPGLAWAQGPATPPAAAADDAPVLRGRVVAVGIPRVSAVAEVGSFHPGGPIHDNPTFAEYTKPGKILDPRRILVTSGSNFGAPRGRAGDPEGSVLSLDPADPASIVVPAGFAAAGDQASALNGRVMLLSAQSPRFLNGVNTPQAATADLPAVSNPLGISINNAFGRLWFASAPAGSSGAGFDSILDPGGQPLAGAPSKLAGGLFAGDLTNRAPQLVPGGLRSGAIGNAFLGASPDGGKRAVFAVLTADGAITQAHTEKNLDGLAPAGTIAQIALRTNSPSSPEPEPMATRAGMIFNWVPDRILYVTDPTRDAIVVLLLTDDGAVFRVKETSRIQSPRLRTPVDLAPAVSEVANPGFSSNTTLAAASDFYVLNRGDGTILRMRQDGGIVAARTVANADGKPLGPGRLNGIAVSRDAAKLWITISGTLPEYPDQPGAVLELPAFGPGRAASLQEPPPAAGTAVERGAQLFSAAFTPAEGLGPLFNGQSCVACHAEPVAGGMGPGGLAPVLRVGRLHDGVFDPLDGSGGPVARAHSVTELGIGCGVLPGIPAQANLVSLRNTPALFGAGLIDAIPEAAIWSDEKGDPGDRATRSGRPNRVFDAQGRERIGRFGWKADIATLEEFVAVALRNELGITNPLASGDLVVPADGDCGAVQARSPKDDGRMVRELTAFIASMAGPPAKVTPEDAPGRQLFARIGCAACHTPELRSANNETIALYSDLLLHDMGPRLADGVVQGRAGSRDWRTTPLWGLGSRSRFLHDGSATSVPAAVLAHDGEAAESVKNYMRLSTGERGQLLGFLARL